MKKSLKTGFSFGLTSGVITTLGLLVGLNFSTASRALIIAGILTIAIADAFSDALGIHISEESKNDSSFAHIWLATLSTFLNKFVFALTFLIPVVFLPLNQAVVLSILWGYLLIMVVSIFIAKQNNEKPFGVVFEHLLITTLVIVLTYFVGIWISKTF